MASQRLASASNRALSAFQNGWWEQQGGSSSYVTNDKWKTLGGTHCCNQTLIEVKKEA